MTPTPPLLSLIGAALVMTAIVMVRVRHRPRWLPRWSLRDFVLYLVTLQGGVLLLLFAVMGATGHTPQARRLTASSIDADGQRPPQLTATPVPTPAPSPNCDLGGRPGCLLATPQPTPHLCALGAHVCRVPVEPEEPDLPDCAFGPRPACPT